MRHMTRGHLLLGFLMLPPITLRCGALGEAAAHAALAATVPTADEPLRTLYVANISPMVPLDRLRELFAIFGQVQDLNVGVLVGTVLACARMRLQCKVCFCAAAKERVPSPELGSHFA
eukprot:360150-Pelagomonas_calceolata.AAC.5